jgi:hypothetical protein
VQAPVIDGQCLRPPGKHDEELERVREYLPVYYDPTRREALFGPGAPLTSQAAIERAIAPAKPVRAIAG